MSGSGQDLSVPHIQFVLEHHLGHETYAQGLRSAIAHRTDVRSTWTPVRYTPVDAWWERLPSEQVKGALRGRREIGAGFVGPTPDATVFNTQVPAAIAPRVARRAPYVLCTDLTPIQYDGMAAAYGHQADRIGPVRWAKHRWNQRVHDRAAAHAPWSNWARRSLIDDYGIDPERIEVIPPGVDPARFAAPPRTGTDPVRILFVGGELERKGGDLLLEAFARLPAGSCELHLVTRSAVARQPRVTVHGSMSPNDPALIDLYRSADLFALPSRAEAFGIAAIEAAAAGLPVIVTNTGGLADLCLDGITGRCIEPGDLDALTSALALLVSDADLRRRMGAAGSERVAAEFDTSANAARLLSLAIRAIGP